MNNVVNFTNFELDCNDLKLLVDDIDFEILNDIQIIIIDDNNRGKIEKYSKRMNELILETDEKSCYTIENIKDYIYKNIIVIDLSYIYNNIFYNQDYFVQKRFYLYNDLFNTDLNVKTRVNIFIIETILTNLYEIVYRNKNLMKLHRKVIRKIISYMKNNNKNNLNILNITDTYERRYSKNNRFN